MPKTIAYITDLHLDETVPFDNGVDARNNWTRILGDIASKQIDQLTFGGDIGEPSSYGWFFDSLKKYSGHLYLTLGNHDQYGSVKNYYSNKFLQNNKELFYDFEDDHFEYIYLDSSSEKISDEQLDFLRKKIIAASKRIILFIHHPVLGIDTAVDREFPLKNRDVVKDVLLSGKKNIQLFCGHYHMEEYRSENNITQYITPSSSFQIEKTKDKIITNKNRFGYRLIELEGTDIKTKVIMFDS
jgi:Icc protein